MADHCPGLRSLLLHPRLHPIGFPHLQRRSRGVSLTETTRTAQSAGKFSHSDDAHGKNASTQNVGDGSLFQTPSPTLSNRVVMKHRESRTFASFAATSSQATHRVMRFGLVKLLNFNVQYDVLITFWAKQCCASVRSLRAGPSANTLV